MEETKEATGALVPTRDGRHGSPAKEVKPQSVGTVAAQEPSYGQAGTTKADPCVEHAGEHV